MTRVICMDNPEGDIKGQMLYMYSPNCWCANPFVAIQFHADGAARQFGDMCGCHEGDYIWDADKEEVVYRWGIDKGVTR